MGVNRFSLKKAAEGNILRTDCWRFFKYCCLDQIWSQQWLRSYRGNDQSITRAVWRENSVGIEYGASSVVCVQFQLIYYKKPCWLSIRVEGLRQAENNPTGGYFVLVPVIWRKGYRPVSRAAMMRRLKENGLLENFFLLRESKSGIGSWTSRRGAFEAMGAAVLTVLLFIDADNVSPKVSVPVRYFSPLSEHPIGCM